MADKKKKDAEWAKAKRVCRLNAETVRMAKELGFTPRNLMKNVPNKSQPWKAPVHVWVRDLYEAKQEKAARKKARKQMEPPCEQPTEDRDGASLDQDDTIAGSRPPYPLLKFPRIHAGDTRSGALNNIDGPVFEDDDFDDFEYWEDDDDLDDAEIKEQNQCLLRRQREFRQAAERVAEELAQLPAVHRVVLFGSVAMRLKKEVPRFRKYRRAGIEVWHECKDVDLAVWVSDLSNLRSLQRARSRALNVLQVEKNIGVAHHQVELFLMEPGTNRYLGRLCTYAACPKGKPDCVVPGCGAVKFLKQHTGFVLRDEALAAGRTVLLYDAESIPGEDLENDVDISF